MSDTAKHSLCATCSMPIGDSSLFISGRLYHHECSPYASSSPTSDTALVERLAFDRKSEMLMPYPEGAFVRYRDYEVLAARLTAMQAERDEARNAALDEAATVAGKLLHGYDTGDDGFSVEASILALKRGRE